MAVRYSAAAAEARIGGDLYALVPTPYGVRLIVGDVRGKGLPAVGTAALVLGVFREAAYDEPDLLDRRRPDRAEPGAQPRLRRLRHRRGRRIPADRAAGGRQLRSRASAAGPRVRKRHGGRADPSGPAARAARPDAARPRASRCCRFADGDQLLLYTDGVTEARDHGREFYPLAEGLARHVSDEPARTLAALHDELLAHVGGRLHDDAALLLLRKPASVEPASAVAAGGGSVTVPSPPRPPAAGVRCGRGAE